MGQSFNKFQCTNEETTPRVHFKEYYIYVYISKNVTRNSNKGIHIYKQYYFGPSKRSAIGEIFDRRRGAFLFFARKIKESRLQLQFDSGRWREWEGEKEEKEKGMKNPSMYVVQYAAARHWRNRSHFYVRLFYSNSYKDNIRLARQIKTIEAIRCTNKNISHMSCDTMVNILFSHRSNRFVYPCLYYLRKKKTCFRNVHI